MSLVAYDDSESDEEKTENVYEEKKLKRKQTVKISIPTINYDSDDESVNKKIKTNDENKRNGLLSILPPPKVQVEKVTTFIPNVLKKKPTTTSDKRDKMTLNTKESLTVNTNGINKSDESGDSDEEEVISNFDEELWKKITAPSKRKTAFTLPVKRTIDSNLCNNTSIIPDIEIAPTAEKPYDGLDNAAFKELVGKGKQKASNIDIIEIHEDEIRPDKQDWLKSLTDPNYAPKQDAENPVNDTCKRKHHITYLAQQAKANELELQNQWAQNRFARKQTQAKYGF